MKFTHKQIAELPFIINVPAGIYPVRLGATETPLEIHHNLYAGSPGPIEYPSPVYVGEKQALVKTLSTQPTYSLLQLHTVVSWEKSQEVLEADLHKPSDNELVEEYERKIIMQRASSNTGAALRAEATQQLAALTQEELNVFRWNTALRRTARSLYPNAEADRFLSALNQFLRIYMDEIGDFFVEEVTLHQVAGTATRGIIRITECDGEIVDSVTVVGKVPPIMRQPWYVHPDDKVYVFKALLADGKDANAVSLLGVRARGLLERGAYRSAIIEAGAAMETAVSRRLIRDMVTQGRTEADALKFLHDNQRFSDRCKNIMKQVSRKSVPELDNTLWERVVGHRDNYRHKIVHSNQEPPRANAEHVVEDFLKLAKLVTTFVG